MNTGTTPHLGKVLELSGLCYLCCSSRCPEKCGYQFTVMGEKVGTGTAMYYMFLRAYKMIREAQKNDGSTV